MGLLLGIKLTKIFSALIGVEILIEHGMIDRTRHLINLDIFFGNISCVLGTIHQHMVPGLLTPGVSVVSVIPLVGRMAALIHIVDDAAVTVLFVIHNLAGLIFAGADPLHAPPSRAKWAARQEPQLKHEKWKLSSRYISRFHSAVDSSRHGLLKQLIHISMFQFHFVTHWRLQACRDRVWALVLQPARLSEWWPGFEQSCLLAGDGEVGTQIRCQVRAPVGFRFNFVAEIEAQRAPEYVRLRACGDLEGFGVWQFSEAGDHTDVTFEWHVRLKNFWVRLFLIVPGMRPLLSVGHKRVMQVGGESLEKLLNDKTPSTKLQIPNKFQISNSNVQKV